ncbi:MAG: glycerol-3-phosphate responsive antiterminator [Clostridia bacterium]
MPMIAAVRGAEALAHALQSPVRVIFLLGGDVFTLPEWVRQTHKSGRHAFVHLDLVEGLSRDAAGVRALARIVQPAGVLSTRAPLLRVAADLGMQTVLRMFMVDRSSLETGARMVKAGAPDFVEIMPGLVTRAIVQMRQCIAQPVIAGGMMTCVQDVQLALHAGACAVSTSSEALWGIRPQDGRMAEED